VAQVSDNGIRSVDGLGIELPSPWFEEALRPHVSASKAYFEVSSVSPQMNLFTPALDSGGRVEGVVKSRIELGVLPEVLSSLNLGEEGVAYVIDKEGQIISHPNISTLDVDTVLSRPVVNKLLTSGYASLLPEDHYYTNEKNNWVIASSTIMPDLGW